MRDLLAAAGAGDQGAWDTIVQRFMPLVWSITSRYRLADNDKEDVSQTVWLRLAEHIAAIREPKALPGWISTTTRHEALAVLKSRRRTNSIDPAGWQLTDVPMDSEAVDEHLLRAERQQALRDGLAELEPAQRQLLLLLVSDPPITYGEIGRRIGIPVGSIGPTRARLLKKLRGTSAVRNFLDVRSDELERGGESR